MKISGILITAVLLAPISLGAAENQKLLSTLQSTHPRLLFTAQDQERVVELARSDALLKRLIAQNEANARRMLEQPPVRYEIPDGLRLLSQSRRCIERVTAMAMAYRLSGDNRFAEGATREMLVAAGFKDWNPRHFLDTAEMTTALAIGYDWLYDQISAEDRATIRQAIVKLGLEPGIKVYEGGGWWVKTNNNWNQVCNGGMLMGALAIAEEEAELAAKTVDFALKSIPNGLTVYPPDGAYPEGPGYWEYGTSYTCLTIEALRTALGTDFRIHESEGLSNTGWYRIHTLGPFGLQFNYADGGARGRSSSTMFALARIYGEPRYAAWHHEQLARRYDSTESVRTGSEDRFFPLNIAWYDAGREGTADKFPLDAFFRNQQDVVTFRSAWGDRQALFLAAKGGDNRTNHGHLDIGSFVLDAQGVRWAVDLGADNYNLPGFFGNKRWTYYRLTNHSHNTLVIDGQLQNTSAKSQVTAFHSSPERASAVIDMTDAYKGQATSVQRGFDLRNRRAVLVQDEIAGAVGTVRWGLVTEADVKLDGNRAVLQQDGQTLVAQILEPGAARFEVLSTKPPTEQENQNQGTRLLATTVVPQDGQKTTIRVLLQPAADQLQPAPPATPLSEWPRAAKP